MGNNVGKALKNLSLEQKDEAANVRQIVKLFSAFDKDHNGTLDRAEADILFASWAKARGMKGEEAEKARVACWHHFDEDGDGSISVFELLRGSAPDLDAILNPPPTVVVSTESLCGKKARPADLFANGDRVLISSDNGLISYDTQTHKPEFWLMPEGNFSSAVVADNGCIVAVRDGNIMAFDGYSKDAKTLFDHSPKDVDDSGKEAEDDLNLWGARLAVDAQCPGEVVMLTASGLLAALCTKEGKIKRVLSKLKLEGTPYLTVAGDVAIVGGAEDLGGLNVIELRTGKARKPSKAYTGGCAFAASHPRSGLAFIGDKNKTGDIDHQAMVVLGDDGGCHIKTYGSKAVDGEACKSEDKHFGWADACAITDAGVMVTSSGYLKSLAIWDVPSQEE